MRIAINIEVAFSNSTGIGRYAREFLRQIIQLDTKHSYTFFHSSQYAWPPPGDTLVTPENFRVQSLPYSRKQLLLSWFFYGGPLALNKCIGIHDVYHDLADILLPVSSARRIASLYDVFILMFPRSFAWHSRMLFHRGRKQIREADAIMTVSKFSKQKIVELLSVRPDKVAVVYGGVGGQFHRIHDTELIRKTCAKHGIDGEYFLFVGVFNRRKNLGSLLRAYRLLRSRRRSNCPRLVCCGKPGIGSEDFYRDIYELRLSNDVKILDSLSDAELAELMAGSMALVMPSLGEGFGLPVAEAMACGAPVICGNQCAMSEVAADAAICIEPTDIEQMAAALERISSDTQLAQSMRERGWIRASEFSWKRTAQEILALYQRLN
jgi:glycosyltransferase involved in cell wall biosynthesis